VTVTAPDVKAAAEWHQTALDFRIMAAVKNFDPEGPEWFFSVTTQNEKSHDFGFIFDFDGTPGRLHHLAFWVETNHDLTEAAKSIIEHGHDVDYGPGQHGIGEQNFLYFRDPAGLRYELNSGGYRNYVPDWEPLEYGVEDGPNNSYFTEVGIPAVHMVAIPPGHVGPMSEERLEGPAAKA
jgi:catechol 2,3-dioxygenase